MKRCLPSGDLAGERAVGAKLWHNKRESRGQV
jgi:hypothetical protein